MKRRERTRRLIELGGLVVKSGVDELTDDDHAVILGALLYISATLRSEGRDQALQRWGRNGKRALAEDPAWKDPA